MSKRRQLSGNVFERDGYWHMRYRLPSGTDSRRKLGPAYRGRLTTPPPGFFTERTARIELDKLLTKYEGYTSGSDPLFKFAADEYLIWKEERKLRGTTLKEYRRIVEKILVPALGENPISRLTEEGIVDLRESLEDRIAWASLNQIRVVLGGIYKYIWKTRKYRGEDFSEWFERAPVKPKTDIDVFTAVEVELVARTLREGGHRQAEHKRPLNEAEILENHRMDDQDAVIVKTAAYAALRLSEIRNLRWRDVDFAGAKITIRKRYTDIDGEQDPKSKKIRTVPMATRVAQELDHLSRRDIFTQQTDLVFVNAFGGQLSGSAIYRRFCEACRVAGLRHLRFHDLRHTAGTLWVQTFDIRRIQEWFGHANIATTQIYLHYKPRTGDAAEMDALLDANLGATLNITTEEVTLDRSELA